MKSYYHYCSAAAAMSILQGRMIWHSDIRYMNDASEYEHGKKDIDAHLEMLRSRISPETSEGKIINNNNFLNLFKNSAWSGEHKSYIFISCFSDQSNSLNQWSFYADGGVCLEFEVDEERKESIFSMEDGQMIQMRKCVYSSEDKKNAIADLFEYLIGRFLPIQGMFPSQEYPRLMALVRAVACSFKDKGFSHESEYRNIIFILKGGLRESEVKFREKNGVLIPYIEKMIDVGKCKRILVGPHRNQSLIYRGIRDFVFHLQNLETHPFTKENNPEVKRSELPYRPF